LSKVCLSNYPSSAPILVDFSEFVKCGTKTGQITQLLHDLRVHRSVREITPRISGALAASLRRASMRFQFWSQICPPTQITLAVDRKTGGAFGYLNWGIGHGTCISTA
jgi:hypothetical protein